MVLGMNQIPRKPGWPRDGPVRGSLIPWDREPSQLRRFSGLLLLLNTEKGTNKTKEQRHQMHIIGGTRWGTWFHQASGPLQAAAQNYGLSVFGMALGKTKRTSLKYPEMAWSLTLTRFFGFAPLCDLFQDQDRQKQMCPFNSFKETMV